MAATKVEKAYCVLELAKTNSVIVVQRHSSSFLYKMELRLTGTYGSENIWMNIFLDDGSACDYLLWGYVKDKVFIPPLPVDIDKLKQCIRNALATVDRHMLNSVWQEFDYRVEICRITNGTHIEHL
ncbi:hypothetical protein QE152_g108 [Popillia japonica]|uniref:Uncharacterized protein n=1 Tax=Popillia japonica TaxID=7064 RepID=A0AAW1NH14_POPJA